MNDPYFQPPVSNGNPYEQALIRRWWTENQNRKGGLVWEYHIDGYYIDAVWFIDSADDGVEYPGVKTNSNFPIKDQNIVICEAKLRLTPELVGQALVYTELARRAGAKVKRTIVFYDEASPKMESVTAELGLDFERPTRAVESDA
jgi:hypothetical protein